VAANLILTDGVPGSGKSVAAQTIARRLRGAGQPARWWYEEELGHPIYLFRDMASLDEVSRDLFSGNHEQVVAAGLERWARFAEEMRETATTVVADGTFFGYLTWTLHYLDRPPEETLAYIRRVQAALAPVDARLVYLRQRDVAATMRNVLAVRGAGWAERAIWKVVDSAYGKARCLEGFDGLVRLWSDYQALTDLLFEETRLAKVVVEVDVGGWEAVDGAVASFLDLPPALPAAAEPLDRFAGDYRAPDGSIAIVQRGDSGLTVRGLHQVWPGQRLMPVGSGAFEVLSLPFTIRFEGELMRVHGPELLGGRPPAELVKLTGSRR
jgi:hypothetical protein